MAEPGDFAMELIVDKFVHCIGVCLQSALVGTRNECDKFFIGCPSSGDNLSQNLSFKFL